MTVGERIKELRISLGLTQEELANKIGYKSRATVNKIESGEREITQTMIVKFANALHVTPSIIMGWEDMPLEKKEVNQKITTVLSKRKDLLAFVNFLVDNEEEIEESDVEKTMALIETFFLDKDNKKKD